MNWPKLKSPKVGRLRRTALYLGVAGGLAGGMLLGAVPAHAALGTEPGDLQVVPATGSTSSTPTWATTVGCPTGYQGSALVEEVYSDGATFSSVSAVVNSNVEALTGAFTGSFNVTFSEMQSIGSIPNGGTQEIFVQCASGIGGTGNVQNDMDVWVTYSSDGTTYSTSNTPPQTGTTTTLAASPTSATTCQTVTLTATVTDADSSTPAGSVQFEAGGTDIGGTVAVTDGVATTTTTFPTAGTIALTAVYTPTSSSYATSTGTASETVTTGTGCNTGAEPISVTIPATGTFTLTVPTGTVNLTVSGSTATGALNTISVSDTRNTYPGWSVSGQEANFTGSGTAAGGSISGNQLGWAPTDTSLATGAVLGPSVTPASPGLGTTAAVLASAVPGGGVGTSGLGANLTLDIPATAIAGPYAGSMTITAVTTGP
jgi:hypothetical protein